VRVVDLDVGASKSDVCAVRVVTISERAGRTDEDRLRLLSAPHYSTGPVPFQPDPQRPLLARSGHSSERSGSHKSALHASHRHRMTKARCRMGVDRDLGDLAGRELVGALHLERGGAGLDLEPAGQLRRNQCRGDVLNALRRCSGRTGLRSDEISGRCVAERDCG